MLFVTCYRRIVDKCVSARQREQTLLRIARGRVIHKRANSINLSPAGVVVSPAYIFNLFISVETHSKQKSSERMNKCIYKAAGYNERRTREIRNLRATRLLCSFFLTCRRDRMSRDPTLSSVAFLASFHANRTCWGVTVRFIRVITIPHTCEFNARNCDELCDRETIRAIPIFRFDVSASDEPCFV